MEVILLADIELGFFVLISEVSPEARAEVNVPAPEAPKDALWVLVVASAELAGFAREFLFCHIVIRFQLRLQ